MKQLNATVLKKVYFEILEMLEKYKEKSFTKKNKPNIFHFANSNVFKVRLFFIVLYKYGLVDSLSVLIFCSNNPNNKIGAAVNITL